MLPNPENNFTKFQVCVEKHLTFEVDSKRDDNPDSEENIAGDDDEEKEEDGEQDDFLGHLAQLHLDMFGVRIQLFVF